MRYYLNWTLAVLFAAATSAIVGCGDSQQPPAGQNGSDKDDDKQHATKGPHGGHLIELGRDHGFHAELVDDHDAGTIRIYILGKDLKEYPISEPTVTLVLTGSSKAFELNAAGVVNGKTARFDAADSSLHEAVEADEEAEGKLRVTIDGTPYTGSLKHGDHDDKGDEGQKH